MEHGSMGAVEGADDPAVVSADGFRPTKGKRELAVGQVRAL